MRKVQWYLSNLPKEKHQAFTDQIIFIQKHDPSVSEDRARELAYNRIKKGKPVKGNLVFKSERQ